MVALLELADALQRRAGEGATLVAKQFTLQQLLGNGRAIDRQKRLLAAMAVVINGARDQFLARAAFAADQGGGIRRGWPMSLKTCCIGSLRPTMPSS